MKIKSFSRLTLGSIAAASLARRGSRLTAAAGRCLVLVAGELVEMTGVAVLLLVLLLLSPLSVVLCLPRCLTRIPISMCGRFSSKPYIKTSLQCYWGWLDEISP